MEYFIKHNIALYAWFSLHMDFLALSTYEMEMVLG